MNVKKLMDTMKERDYLKRKLDEQTVDFKKQLGENSTQFQKQLNEKAKLYDEQLVEKAKSNARLDSIEIAFEETENNLRSGHTQHQELVETSEESSEKAKIALLEKTVNEQSRKLQAQSVDLVQKSKSLDGARKQLADQASSLSNA